MDGIQPSGKKKKDEPQFTDHGRIRDLRYQMYSRATQPAQRPRRPLSQTPRTTPEDWERDTHDEPVSFAPQRQRRRFSLPMLFLVASVVVFIAASAVAASFILSGSNIVSSDNVHITINGPRTIEGGDIVELQVSVRNDNAAVLELADLVVTYPEGTRMPADTSQMMRTQRIPLGEIEPGGSRNGTIRAVLFGSANQRQDITVALEYRLAGSSALFASEALHTVLISSGTLGLSVETNEEVIAGQRVAVTATITSQAQAIVSDVVVRASYPFGFTLDEVVPEAARGEDNLWELGDLRPGESRTIRVLGELDGQTGDTRVFRFLALTQDTVNESGREREVDVVHATLEREVSIVRPFLDMSLAYDNLPAASYVARNGVTIPITLNWHNTLDVALTDVVIAATIIGSGVDEYTIAPSDGFYRSIDSVVLWDKTTTGGVLANVAPGERGEFLVRMTPAASEDLIGIENPTIDIELHAAAQRLGETRVPETIRATVRDSIKLASDPTFEVGALYFENPLGSIGPLPPKVEHETTYGVLWELTNSTSLVRDAKVTAVLPPYVRWLGTVSPSVERVTFNENDGTVTWHVGRLLANTGVIEGDAPRRVVFSIGLVPSTSQVGEMPVLVQSQVLTGLDDFVAEPVSISAPDITTRLSESEFVDVYGTVVP